MQNRDPYIRDIGSRIILFSSSWVSIMVLLAALKSCGNHPVRGTLVTCWAPLSEVVEKCMSVCVRHAPCSHVYTRAHACAHAAVKPLLMLVFASSAGL